MEFWYRGKTKEKDEWVEGHLEITTIEELNGTHKEYKITDIIIGAIPLDYMEGLEELVRSETVGMFTGQIDKKHDRKIFEHDLVKYHFGDDVGIVRFGEYASPNDNQFAKHVGFFIDWVKGSRKDMLRKDLGFWVDLQNDHQEYDIFVGNAFDNPELLLDK